MALQNVETQIHLLLASLEELWTFGRWHVFSPRYSPTSKMEHEEWQVFECTGS